MKKNGKSTGRIAAWLKARPKRWGNRYDLLTNRKLNRSLNWLILALETIFLIYAINTWYGCPCAFRTCGLKHIAQGGYVDWEARNLDCSYVEEYLANRTVADAYQPNMPSPFEEPETPPTDNATRLRPEADYEH